MFTAKIPLLLTSSVIVHDRGVALKDTGERIRLALESVEEWLRIDPNLPIVLCDGSSFDFTNEVEERFPKALIECLSFENNQDMVRSYGRGYGEGEIVRYALHHSKLIAQAGCFAKCSSKLWVENFLQCSKKWNENFLCKGVFSNVFFPLKKTELSYIDTRFYISSLNFYRQNLIDAHLSIDKRKGYGLEHSFLVLLNKKKFKRIMFTVSPVISGVGGGTGTYYKNSWVRRYKESLRLTLVRAHPKFKFLFI